MNPKKVSLNCSNFNGEHVTVKFAVKVKIKNEKFTKLAIAKTYQMETTF